MSTSNLTPETVRRFLLTRYATGMASKIADPAQAPDNFDFLLEGVVDSFGVLEMVSEIEKEFGLELDMSGLDAEQMTVLGPLVRYVASQANGASLPGSSGNSSS